MLQQTQSADALAERLASPPDPLGKAGFSIPSVEGLTWHAMPGGANNWILAGDTFPTEHAFDVAPTSTGHILILEPGARCRGRLLIRGCDSIAIVMRDSTGPVNVHFHSSKHFFYWGKGATSNTATFEMGTDGTAIIVGEDCMFSAFIDATTCDHHAIVDLTTGKHINPAADIIFEPHVWVGMHAMVLKGVRVGFGSIVGAHALVTKDVPSKSAVAGVPARVRRSNVSWTRSRSPETDALQALLEMEQKFG